jgi:predicted TIM-barrel fold metal-dependent hydrolase
MNTDGLIAIDVHVHLETEIDDNAANEAAKKYFGDAGVGRNRYELADYYRSRKIGCVVFTVDERLTGSPPIPNDEIAAFAAENADIMFAFASVDPTRGKEAVDEAKRLIAAGGIRGFKLHPPLQQFHANDNQVYTFSTHRALIRRCRAGRRLCPTISCARSKGTPTFS